MPVTVDRAAGRSAVLADGRGLTAAGGVLLLLAVGLAGAGYDLSTGSGLRLVFAGCFVAGCGLVASLVHREDLKAAAIMPPLAFAVLAVVAGLVQSPSGTGSLVVRQGLELFNALVRGAPVLGAGTALAALIALARGLAGRTRRRRR